MNGAPLALRRGRFLLVLEVPGGLLLLGPTAQGSISWLFGVEIQGFRPSGGFAGLTHEGKRPLPSWWVPSCDLRVISVEKRTRAEASQELELSHGLFPDLLLPSPGNNMAKIRDTTVAGSLVATSEGV